MNFWTKIRKRSGNIFYNIWIDNPCFTSIYAYTCSSPVLKTLNLNMKEATCFYFSAARKWEVKIYECSEHENFTSKTYNMNFVDRSTYMQNESSDILHTKCKRTQEYSHLSIIRRLRKYSLFINKKKYIYICTMICGTYISRTSYILYTCMERYVKWLTIANLFIATLSNLKYTHFRRYKFLGTMHNYLSLSLSRIAKCDYHFSPLKEESAACVTLDTHSTHPRRCRWQRRRKHSADPTRTYNAIVRRLIR